MICFDSKVCSLSLWSWSGSWGVQGGQILVEAQEQEMRIWGLLMASQRSISPWFFVCNMLCVVLKKILTRGYFVLLFREKERENY